MRPHPPTRPARSLAARTLAAAALLAALAAIAWRDTNVPRLGDVTVAVPGLERQVDILHVSDLQEKWFGPGQRVIAGLLEGRRYDVVVITGDLLHSRSDGRREPALALVRVLRRHSAVLVFVRGNHDTATFGAELAEEGVRDLDAGGAVGFAEDAFVGSPRSLEESPAIRARLRVAAVHIPPQDLAPHGGSPILYLAGHTHGGQVRLPLIGAVIAPVVDTGMSPAGPENLLPDLRGLAVKGLYRRGSDFVHVTPGLGTTFLDLRFLDQAEITHVRCVPAER